MGMAAHSTKLNSRGQGEHKWPNMRIGHKNSYESDFTRLKEKYALFQERPLALR